MNKRFFAAVTAIMLLACAGCDSGSAAPVVTTQGASVLSSGTSLNKTVVTFDGNKDMDITFGDFLKEYKYYLSGNGVTDDSVEPFASSMIQQREYIINYLINDRIMEKKFDELGLSFTDEELQQIDTDTKTGIDNMIENFKYMVQSTLTDGQTLSEEELASRAKEEYNNMLTECGLTEDDFASWQRSIYIQDKINDYVNADFTYEYSEAESEVMKKIEEIKANYEKDPTSYNPEAYKGIWIPEGSRYVQHILLKFDDETVQQLSTMRKDGKTADADKLRDEKIAAMAEEIAEVEGKVNAGEEFSELMKQYSDDIDTSMSYLIPPGTTMYMDGFAECAMAIPAVGGTDTVITDYGWHMIKYTSEAVLADEDLEVYIKNMHAYLSEQYRMQNLNTQMAEWRASYNYTIDRETLMLAEETAEAAQ